MKKQAGLISETSLIIGTTLLLLFLPLITKITTKEKTGEIRKEARETECFPGECCSSTQRCSFLGTCVNCPSGYICRNGNCILPPTPTPSQDECQTPDDCQAPGRCNVSCYGSPRRCHWTPCPTSSPTPTSFPSCTSCTNPSAPVGAVRCNANGNVSECVRRYNQCYWQQVTDCQGRGCTNGQCNSSSSTPTRISSPTPLPSFQGCTNPLGNLGETRCSENNILSTCVARYGVYFWSGQVCPYGCEVINNVAQCRSSLPTSLPSPSPSSFTSPPSCRQQGQSCTGSGQGNCCSGLVCVSVRGYPVCQPGCIPGEKRCSSDGKFLEECQNNQWVPIKRCDNGCDSTKKECNPVCIPNTTKCFDANTLQTCASDGSGWTKEYCSYGCQETAKGAFCISPTPTPISEKHTAKYSSSFTSIPPPIICSPGEFHCVGENYRVVCKDDGSGFREEYCKNCNPERRKKPCQETGECQKKYQPCGGATICCSGLTCDSFLGLCRPEVSSHMREYQVPGFTPIYEKISEQIEEYKHFGELEYNQEETILNTIITTLYEEIPYFDPFSSPFWPSVLPEDIFRNKIKNLSLEERYCLSFLIRENLSPIERYQLNLFRCLEFAELTAAIAQKYNIQTAVMGVSSHPPIGHAFNAFYNPGEGLYIGDPTWNIPLRPVRMDILERNYFNWQGAVYLDTSYGVDPEVFYNEIYTAVVDKEGKEK